MFSKLGHPSFLRGVFTLAALSLATLLPRHSPTVPVRAAAA